MNTVRNPFAHKVIPGMSMLTGGALVGENFDRRIWAERVNRAVTYTGKPCKVSYSHGSTGHYDADGCFRSFGGPMIFSAWCACGRFRYHGDSETGRRNAIKAHKTWVTLGVNDVVTDCDRRSQHYGCEFVITAADGDLLTLEDVQWGDVRLSDVHRAFVESAGRNWVAVTCGHPRYHRRSSDGRCMTYGCTG